VLSAPDPGLEQGFEFAFERPAAGVEGATLHCTTNDPIRAYGPELVVALDQAEGAAGYEQSKPPVRLSTHEPEVIS